MSRSVSILMHKDAISNGDQCLCLIRYRSSFGAVAVLSALAGLLTLAILTISCSASGVQWTKVVVILLQGDR